MTGARIFDGDIVFIKAQSSVDNGQIAAVVINDEATLKRVYYYPEEGKLILSPENPRYAPLVYLRSELNTIKIIGKVHLETQRISLAAEGLESKFGYVIERISCAIAKKSFLVVDMSNIQRFFHFKCFLLCGFKQHINTAEHHHRQNDFFVLAFLKSIY